MRRMKYEYGNDKKTRLKKAEGGRELNEQSEKMEGGQAVREGGVVKHVWRKC